MERQSITYFYVHSALHSGWLVVERPHLLTKGVCNDRGTLLQSGASAWMERRRRNLTDA